MTDTGDWVDVWVRGWVVSRRTPAAEPIPGGWLVATGSEWEAERRVLRSTGHLEEAARAASHRPSWIKYAVDPGDDEPSSPGEHWELSDLDWLMVVNGRPSAPAPDLPPGYRIERSWEGECAVVRVLLGDEIAASGRCGVADGIGVPDQIVTESSHRRRGLGRVVMRRLADAASEAGATDLVLVASDDGRALYSALGWRVLARFPAFVLR